VSDAAQALSIEGSCPECGAAYTADLWDRSHECEYCESLLVWSRRAADDAYVVTDGDPDPARVLEILVTQEAEAYRARLLARLRGAAPMAFEPPGLERQVQRFRENLRADLQLVEAVDFFAPYVVRDTSIVQAILGRRKLGVKESFLQLFQSQELERAYDDQRFHLRDRGLKIRSFRPTPMRAEHFELAGGRFLPRVEPPDEARLDRSQTRLSEDTQVVARIGGSFRRRELRVYKHLSYAKLRRAGHEEHYLFDRQFGTVAARLHASEVGRYRDLAPSSAEQLMHSGDVHAIASECPNCGFELHLPPQELVQFCPSCHQAVELQAKGLVLRPYRVERSPEGAERWLYFPFWAFPVRVRDTAGPHESLRAWRDAVSPSPAAPDTAPAGSERASAPRYFLPARSIYGSPRVDHLFEQLVGDANARQPELQNGRPVPDDRAQWLGVDLDAADARSLARFALVALFDNARTRYLHAQIFRERIAAAELELGEAELALLALPLRNDAWRPGGSGRAIRASLLRGERTPPLVTRSHGLRPRRRSSS
jgi:hypothetical protein